MVSETLPLSSIAIPADLRLRELAGHDEHAVACVGTADALRLLDALLQPSADGSPPPRAGLLPSAHRDQLLAELYRETFGDRIESTLSCAACGNPFDLDFSLVELAGSLRRPSAALCGGLFERAGMRFRLPTGDDELAIVGLPLEEAETALLARCVESGAAHGDRAALQETLEEIAPLLALELAARCPECARVQTICFDIQSFLLGALLADRRRLLTDIHRLAVAYGWSRADILSLTRRERRQLVELVENEPLRRVRSRK